MIRRLTVHAFLICSSCVPAMADEAAPAPSAYRAVMGAQYAARQPPLPARPEEAQRIYENYLQSIGKPARDLSSDWGGNTTSPSR